MKSAHIDKTKESVLYFLIIVFSVLYAKESSALALKLIHTYYLINGYIYLIVKDLARPQHRTVMVFVTDYHIGNVPNF